MSVERRYEENVRGRNLTEHLSSEVVAAFRDGGLSASDRAVAELHLAHCVPCRQEMIEVDRFLANGARPHTRIGRSALAGLGLAAAVVFGFVIIQDIDDSSGGERMRGEEGLAAMRQVTAMDPAGVVELPVRFAWTSSEAGAFYRFSLVEEDGSALYSTGTRDTSLDLPDSVGLVGGETYFWYVDAILTDGRSITTGFQSFTVEVP